MSNEVHPSNIGSCSKSPHTPVDINDPCLDGIPKSSNNYKELSVIGTGAYP